MPSSLLSYPLVMSYFESFLHSSHPSVSTVTLHFLWISDCLLPPLPAPRVLEKRRQEISGSPLNWLLYFAIAILFLPHSLPPPFFPPSLSPSYLNTAPNSMYFIRTKTLSCRNTQYIIIEEMRGRINEWMVRAIASVRLRWPLLPLMACPLTVLIPLFPQPCTSAS